MEIKRLSRAMSIALICNMFLRNPLTWKFQLEKNNLITAQNLQSIKPFDFQTKSVLQEWHCGNTFS